MNLNSDNHRLCKLLELAQVYNTEHPDSVINLEKYTTHEELVFSLWQRKVDIKDLGFGQPFD